jgi:hypothetical protein
MVVMVVALEDCTISVTTAPQKAPEHSWLKRLQYQYYDMFRLREKRPNDTRHFVGERDSDDFEGPPRPKATISISCRRRPLSPTRC